MEALKRAERDLAAADAADRLFVRLARRFQSLPRAEGRSACSDRVRAALVARALAAWFTFGERLAAAGARVDELRAVAASDTRALLFPSDIRRIGLAQDDLGRLRRLAAADQRILEAAVEGPLGRAGCDPEAVADVGRTLAEGGPQLPTPPPFVPDRTVAVGVQAGTEPVMVWVDGSPVRALAPAEMAVLALPACHHDFCASPLEAGECVGALRETPEMGRWYIARPGAVRPAGEGQPPAPALAVAPPHAAAGAGGSIPDEVPVPEPPPEARLGSPGVLPETVGTRPPAAELEGDGGD